MKQSVYALIPILTLATTSSFAQSEEEQTIAQQLGQSPSDEVIQLTYQSNPDLTLDILEILLASDNVDQLKAVETAMSIAPERALEIAEIARKVGLSNEDITTAAILAGVDPTLFAEPTAAGLTGDSPAIPTATVALPSAPAVGGNGGGGFGSAPSSGGGDAVSPN
jgi:hypothetical protein